MTGGFAAGYQMESGEARALGSINTESYDYRDQAKLLTKLTSDVSYMAQYMRQMQKGIDDANKNFIEQIGDFVNEILVVIGGGGNTGFDFGDLKYIFQAIGALFGFDQQTGIGAIFPINLFNAGWHFFSTYILPINNFGDAIDNFIDSAIATVLDVLGEIPIVGQAVQTLAMWISDLRDGITNGTAILNGIFSDWNQGLVNAIKNIIQVVKNLVKFFTGNVSEDIFQFEPFVRKIDSKSNQGLRGLVSPSRLPLLPVSNIGSTNPNLLVEGSFDSAETLDTSGNFSWDSEGRTKPGSAKVVANNEAKSLFSNQIEVVAGQKFDIGAYVKWSGVTASSGNPAFKISVTQYNEEVTGTTVDIATINNPNASSNWTYIFGDYTVPNSGVDSIRVRIKVTEFVSAGTIKWDDLFAKKQGLLGGNLVSGIDSGSIVQNIQTTWNSFVAGFTNIGNVIADVTGLDFSQTVSETSEAIAANAMAITKLQTTATYNANSGIQEFINFSDANHVPGSSVSSLGSRWAQLYDGSGSGTLGISSGRATWNWVNNANRLCIARYTAKASLTDYQRIGVAYASAPGKDIFGNQAFNYIYGRMSSGSTLPNQTYVYAKLGKNSCEVGCVVNGAPRVFETKTNFSFKANSVYWLECGQLGGLNQIRLIDNNGNAVISYTDDDAPGGAMYSMVGQNYRWAGLGGFAFANGIGHFEPGSMLAFSLADNAPQPIVGSGLRRYRDSATGVNLSAGTNLLDGSFFDTPDGSTDEYEYTHSENKIKVLKAGWYCVSLSIKFSDFLNYPFNNITVAPVLYKMGNVYAFGSEALGAGGGGNYRIAHTWIVYLNKDEYVQPGYNANLDPIQNAIGSDTGAETFWQISLLNWSLT